MVLAYDNIMYTNPFVDILVGSNAYLSKLKPWVYVSFEHMLSKLEIVSIPWIKIVLRYIEMFLQCTRMVSKLVVYICHISHDICSLTIVQCLEL